MELRTTDNIFVDTAEHLEGLIEGHVGDTLCLLAGGSAYSVFEAINISEDAKGRTIFCMGDERVSGEAEINNFLQLQDKASNFAASHTVIDTSAEPEESAKDFAQRISVELENIFAKSENLQIISILGMGEDGHTASIFPVNDTVTENWFRETYEADSTYVPVHNKTLTIEHRASITPSFILERVDHVVGFIYGAQKADKLSELIEADLEIAHMPIQIVKKHKSSVVFTDIELN